MERPTLDGLPEHPLPPGFSVTWFRPGDEKKWLDIHCQAEEHVEISPKLFACEFGSDWEVLSRRQCYLLDDASQPIGTATAWFDDDYYGERYGRLHWVAVVPEYQGRGLAYLKKGLPGPARDDYDKALSLNPDADSRKEIEKALETLGPDPRKMRMQ